MGPRFIATTGNVIASSDCNAHDLRNDMFLGFFLNLRSSGIKSNDSDDLPMIPSLLTHMH